MGTHDAEGIGGGSIGSRRTLRSRFPTCPAAIFLELLDDLINVHAGILTLDSSTHGLPPWR